jgi:starch phosphorylase
MKAALNGALNCSILDGWWDEAYDGRNGWSIDSFEDHGDLAWRDRMEAESLFQRLEADIVPTFYERTDGLPRRWLEMVKHGWATIGPAFTASRMVREYVTEMYEPATRQSNLLAADGGSGARELAAWKSRVLAAWPYVRVTVPEPGTVHPTGERRVVAHVELPGLGASDVAAQLIHGPLGPEGEMVAPAVLPMELTADGTAWRAEQTFTPVSGGSYGCTVRVVPVHAGQSHPLELGRIAWAVR